MHKSAISRSEGISPRLCDMAHLCVSMWVRSLLTGWGLFYPPYIFYFFKKSRVAVQATAPAMSTSIMLPNHILI